MSEWRRATWDEFWTLEKVVGLRGGYKVPITADGLETGCRVFAWSDGVYICSKDLDVSIQVFKRWGPFYWGVNYMASKLAIAWIRHELASDQSEADEDQRIIAEKKDKLAKMIDSLPWPPGYKPE